MAQVQSSHQQFVGGPRFHTRQGSASSILAATTFGVNYNPMATPSSTTGYDGMTWSSTPSVSPSIWSPNHVGHCQWPAVRQTRAPPVMGYFNPAGYLYPPRQQPLSSGVAGVPPAAAAVPAATAQAQAAQVPALGQSMLLSQVPGGLSIQQVPMPVPAAYPAPPQMMPQVPGQFPMYPLRAPMQSYQAIAGPDASGAAPLEYNVNTMSRFVAAVGSGLLLGKVATLHELASLEQFIQALLCATRLSRSTVLTSIVLLNQFVTLRKKDAQLQRLSMKNCFLVSFVLANKINDDNTFTNASWGLVSGISAKQLTSLELSWLQAAKWNISLDSQGENEWTYWQDYWLQTEQQSMQQCPSPVTPTSLWPNQGYFFEPFSVAAC